MLMDEGDARLLKPVTERIIGCAFTVAHALVRGFVETVYENAVAHEMRKSGGSASSNNRESWPVTTT
jgi:GxxExxY protein